MRVGIVGAGWAGLAAAIEAARAGHAVTLFEAARTPGGRARTVVHTEPIATPNTGADVAPLMLDNGQHIMIGAYAETLRLMRTVGVEPDSVLLRTPLSLRHADGTGLSLPDWPAPWDALAGIASAGGWRWRDKLGLLRAAAAWRLAGFRCEPGRSVAELCAGLSPRVNSELIELLCVSALNTAAERASAQVFLRVMQDSLLGPRGGSNLLIPRVPLGELFPEPAVAWLRHRGHAVQFGHRVSELRPRDQGWRLDDQAFDHVVLACPSWEASRLVQAAGIDALHWLRASGALRFEAITTVYARSEKRMKLPMTTLRSGPQAPAQFVFDRRHLQQGVRPDAVPRDAVPGDEPRAGRPDMDDLHDDGILAFVVSVSEGSRDDIERQVLAQGRTQLGLVDLRALLTIVDKRATFSCTPGLERPAPRIAEALSACGEYVAGPYPGTLEGAVRSGVEAAAQL